MPFVSSAIGAGAVLKKTNIIGKIGGLFGKSTPAAITSELISRNVDDDPRMVIMWEAFKISSGYWNRTKQFVVDELKAEGNTRDLPGSQANMSTPEGTVVQVFWMAQGARNKKLQGRSEKAVARALPSMIREAENIRKVAAGASNQSFQVSGGGTTPPVVESRNPGFANNFRFGSTSGPARAGIISSSVSPAPANLLGGGGISPALIIGGLIIVGGFLLVRG